MTDDKHQLAIIVPYRNRARNLRLWLEAMSRYPQIRRMTPSVHIVCQANRQMFNKGRLINIGFRLAPDHDYYCIHDVDLLPVSADYSFPSLPAHLASRVSQFGYRKPYEGVFGGVTIFRRDHFIRINGFSNQYFDWGGEDDDTLIRCRRSGLDIEWRDGIFYSLSHELNFSGLKPNHVRNMDRLEKFRSGEIDLGDDGLSCLTYVELARETRDHVYSFPLTVHHVQFSNHDLGPESSYPAGYMKPEYTGTLRKVGNRIQSVDSNEEIVGQVNEQSAFILQQCTGDNSIDCITSKISSQFAESTVDIERDVPIAVDQFVNLGLCSYNAPKACEYVLEPLPLGRKTITITTNNRPENYSGLLESLSDNATDDYDLVMAIEPGNEENKLLSERFPHPSKTMLFNPVQLGVRVNPYSVLEYVFENGAGFNIYLEDDLELAIDAVDLANWFFESNLDEDTIALGLHSGSTMIDMEQLDKVYVASGFSALGVALTRHAWEHWFRLHWFNDHHGLRDKGTGWDYSINALFRSDALNMLYPVCSRVRHTGRIGVHMKPEYHDRVLAGVTVNRIRRIREFHVI